MITYRKAGMCDIPELMRLRAEFLAGVNGRAAPEAYEGNLREYLETALADGGFAAWLAEEDGRVVATSGVCFYRIAPNFTNPTGRIAYIVNMYTIPACRRRGLASELLGRLIEEARARGCGKLALNATEEGRKVYEKFGFAPQDGDMARKLDL
jgi:GNAT superfamily N-acetyltransferase